MSSFWPSSFPTLETYIYPLETPYLLNLASGYLLRISEYHHDKGDTFQVSLVAVLMRPIVDKLPFFPAMAELDPQAQNMSRLLTAVDRIRAERDGLRRDLEFIKMENKFKIEALEAQLAHAGDLHTSNATSSQGRHISDSAQLKQAQRGAFVSILVSQHLSAQCDTYRSRALALSTALEEARKQSMEVDGLSGEMQKRLLELEEENAKLKEDMALSEGHRSTAESEIASLQRRFVDEEELKKGAERRIAQLQMEKAVVQEDLLFAQEQLQDAETQVSELTSRISSLEQDVASERASHQVTGASFAQAEQQVAELSNTIVDTETERDSLALRVTHLEQDLATAQLELEEAEARFSELQAEQLSSMSSTEVNQTLRRKIEDLEYRVNHRTEQVGIHQHDIKRLETNLRLQEERVMEMTADMEVLQGEKTAMIEDCNTTREERDEALRRCEELEERVELLEEESARVEMDRDVEMQTMVEVVFREKASRRRVSRKVVSSLSAHAQEKLQLRAQLHEAIEAKTHVMQQLERLDQERNQNSTLVDEKAAELQSLHNERDAALAKVRETSEALEAVRAELTTATSSLVHAHDQGASTHDELAQLQTQFQSKLTEFNDLQTRYQSLCTQYDDSKASLTAQVSDLEAQIRSLQDANADIDSRRQHAEQEVTRITEELQLYRSSGSESALIQERLRSELDNVRATHLEEVGGLRAEIAQGRVDLEDARQQQIDLQACHKLALDDLTHAKEDLEAKLAEVTEKLQSSDSTHGELMELQDRYSSETKDLRERLDRVSRQLEAAQKELEEQDAGSQEVIRKLEEQLADASDVLHAKEDLEMVLAQVRTQHDAEIKSLERRIADLTSEENTVRQSQSELETRCQELGQEKSDLEDNLARVTADVEQLQDQLRILTEKHDLALERHSQELKAAADRADEHAQTRRELVDQLADIRSQLEETQVLVNALQEDKQDLQGDMTQLEAEIQRLLSLQRYQESQFKDGCVISWT